MGARSAPSGAPALKLRPVAFGPPGQVLTLADLLEGDRPEGEFGRRLAGTPVGHALGAGQTQELGARELAVLLRAATGGGPTRFEIPRVVRLAARLDPRAAGDAITEELLAAWRPLCADCRLAIEDLSLPRVAGTISLRSKPRGELPHGTFSVPVEVARVGLPTVSAWINGRLTVRRRVPVATRQLARPARLSREDIAWEWRDLSGAYDGLPGEDEISRKRLKRDLRVGDILFSGALEAERAVRRGETVQARYGEGGVEVSVNAVADRDGALGDVVHLKTVKGGIGLEGQVTGAGEVRLR